MSCINLRNRSSSIRSQLKKLLGNNYWQLHTTDILTMHSRFAMVQFGPENLSWPSNNHLYQNGPMCAPKTLFRNQSRPYPKALIVSREELANRSNMEKPKTRIGPTGFDLALTGDSEPIAPTSINNNEYKGNESLQYMDFLYRSQEPPNNKEPSILGPFNSQGAGKVAAAPHVMLASPFSEPSISTRDSGLVDQTASTKNAALPLREFKTDPGFSDQRSSRVPSINSLRRRIGSYVRPQSVASHTSLVRRVLNASNADSMSYQGTPSPSRGTKYVRPILKSALSVARYISSSSALSSLSAKEERMFRQFIDQGLLDSESITPMSTEFRFSIPWRPCCDWKAILASLKHICEVCGASLYHYMASQGQEDLYRFSSLGPNYSLTPVSILRSPDFLGNNCHHFLASSKAPLSLLRKYFLSEDCRGNISNTNAVGYTALHVLNPEIFGFNLSSLPEFLQELGNMDYNFHQLGCDGRNFLHNLLWHPEVKDVSFDTMCQILKKTNIPTRSQDSTGRCIYDKLSEWFEPQDCSALVEDEERRARSNPYVTEAYDSFGRLNLFSSQARRILYLKSYIKGSDVSDRPQKGNPSMDFNDESATGETIVSAMVVYRSNHRAPLEPILRLLYSGVNFNVCGPNGSSPIVCAMETGQYDLVEAILEATNDIRVIRPQIYTYSRLLIEAHRKIMHSFEYVGAVKCTALVLQSLEKHHRPSLASYGELANLLQVDPEQSAARRTSDLSNLSYIPESQSI